MPGEAPGTTCCASSATRCAFFWKDTMLGVSYSSLSSPLEISRISASQFLPHPPCMLWRMPLPPHV